MFYINYILKDVLVYIFWFKLNWWNVYKIIILLCLWKYSLINIVNVICCNKCICLIDNISLFRINLLFVKFR